jgi:ribosomal protein S12 methylthiotransferase accessory factor
LRSEATALTTGAGDRAVAPETTFARYRHHVSPITGLVSDLRALTAADRPSPLHAWRAAAGQAWGKGTTAAQARTAALCEALEMASGRFTGDEPRVRASFGSLGARAIHPNACMLFSDRQYAHREAWNTTSTWFRRIPEPFDDNAEIDWVHAWSMTRETFRLLPAEYCYYGHPDRPARAVADFSGQGSGNTLEEAVLHAMLELVERDAVAIWWFNRVRRPAVDIDGIDDPIVEAVRAHAVREGRELWVLDVTGDLGIPVFAAISRACDGPERISFGFGASLDPRVALVRALGEVHQIGWTMSEAKDRWLRQWWQTATIADHPYLVPDAAASSRRVRDDHRATGTGTMAAIGEIRARLEREGLETLLIDQTRPDIGLPTVRVIVPGLRQWRPPRYAPGRLYDVPVRLGWLAAPLREDELNPLFPPA